MTSTQPTSALRSQQELANLGELSARPSLKILDSLLYPWNRSQFQRTYRRRLSYVRYCLDLNQSGKPLYLERLLGLKMYPRKWNTIQKEISRLDPSLPLAGPGA